MVSRSKASLSGLEFRVLSRELSEALDGSYISNIYSIGESQLLRMRKSAGNGQPQELSLVLSPKLGAWITESPSRFETAEFTSGLRSHLLRAKLRSVSQVDLDRVLILSFEGKGEEGTLKLVLELMPPGNIVLAGPDDKVIVALRETRGERSTRRGSAYVPPEPNRASPETLTREELVKVLARERTLGRALGRGLSIPRRYVDEILARLSLGQDDSTEVSDEEADRIFATIGEVVASLKDPWPCLVKAQDGSTEVMVVRPKSREILDSFPTLSPLLDRLFASGLIELEESEGESGEEAEARQSRASELRATIKDLESKEEALSALATSLRKLAAEVRRTANAGEAKATIKAHGPLPKDLVSALESLSEKGAATLSSAIFDRAKMTEEEIQDVRAAIGRLGQRLKKEAAKHEAQRTKAIPVSTARKEWYEKFRWFFTTGGKLAVGGRDAQSNTSLVRRHLESGDTVYHADLFGSPFFILKGGTDQKEEEVREVAKATVSFSSAWKTGLGAADAYWVRPDQVGAAGPSGEYLAHGSFMIKGKKNFVSRNPVEIAVGIDEKGRVVSGPEESIMRVARAHVAIVPGREKPSDTAKKVLHELRPYANPEVSVGVDDVLRMLPAGGGKIVRRKANR